jgi:SAM-dependent methyltransferase
MNATMDTNKTVQVCPICSADALYFMTKDNFYLYKCHACHVVYVYPQPSDRFIKKEVYSTESGYQSNKPKILDGFQENTRLTKTFDVIQAYRAQGKLLDVGCSNGEFMYLAKQRGFEPCGVELNARTATIARDNGFPVVLGVLDDAHYPDAFFDVIYLGDIIEHVKDPHSFISECARILKPGGLIVISTPNLDCLWSQMTLPLYSLFTIPWSSVTPPYHLHQFSDSNLNILMGKHGFSPHELWFNKPPRLMYELGSLHLLKEFKKNHTIIALIKMVIGFSLYTLLYGINTLVFWKKKDFSMVACYIKQA